MIQKFIHQLKLKKVSNPQQVEKTMSGIIKNELANEIEKIIENLDIELDVTIIIDRISIDIGKITENQINTEFIRQFLLQFKKQLIEQINEQTTNQEHDFQKIKNPKLYAINIFLEKGYFPWWFKLKETDTLNSLISKQIYAQPTSLLQILLNDSKEIAFLKIERLSKQIDLKPFKYLLLELNIFKQKEFSHISEIVSKEKDKSRITKIFSSIISNPVTEKFSISDLEEDIKIKIPEIKKQIETIQLNKKHAQELLNKYADIELVPKQFALNIFPYEFLKDIFTYFLQKNKFPDFTEKFISRIKQENNYKSDFQVYEKLYQYLSDKHKVKFENFTKQLSDSSIKLSDTLKVSDNLAKQLSDSLVKLSDKHFTEKYKDIELVPKQFSLDIFPYQFLKDIFIFFLQKNQFPDFTEKFIYRIKQENNYKSDFQVYERLYQYLSDKHKDKFENFKIKLEAKQLSDSSIKLSDNLKVSDNFIELSDNLAKLSDSLVKLSDKYFLEKYKNIELVPKQFSLDIFPYQFLKDIFIFFLQKNEFPDFTEKFISRIKQKNNYKSDFQVYERLYQYLSDNHKDKFENFTKQLLDSSIKVSDTFKVSDNLKLSDSLVKLSDKHFTEKYKDIELVPKQFSLNIFPYEFLKDIFIFFLQKKEFPEFTEKFISKIKHENELNSDFQVYEKIYQHLSKQHKYKFENLTKQLSDSSIKLSDTFKVSDNFIELSDNLKLSDNFIDLSDIDDEFKEAEYFHKQFNLVLFPYEFIKDIFSHFVITNKFPDYSIEFVNRIKREKQIKSNLKILEMLFTHLSINHKNDFKSFFLKFIGETSIVQIITQYYPAVFVQQFLIFIFKNKIEYILKFIQDIEESIINTHEVSKVYAKIYARQIVFLNIQEIDNAPKQQLTSLLLEKLLQKEPLEIITPSKYLAIIKQILEYGFPASLDSNTFSQEIILQFKNLARTPLQNILDTKKAREIFVLQFPDKLIISVIKKLYKEKFEILQKIWKELLIIIEQSELKFIPKKITNKFLQTIALDVITDKKLTYYEGVLQESTKKEWLLKYYLSFKELFASQKYRINFETIFFSSIQQLTNKQVPEFFKLLQQTQEFQEIINVDEQKDVKRKIHKSLIENYLSEINIKIAEKNKAIIFDEQIIAFNLIYYLQTGILHYTSSYETIEELTKIFLDRKTQILTIIKNELNKILHSKIIIQRLFAIFTEQTANALIEETISILPDEIKQILTDSKKENIEEIKTFFPDTKKEEIYTKLIEEKFDWLDSKNEDEKMYVENAGLVLLCTFLNFLFKRLRLIKRVKNKNEFVSDEAQERAIHLTQYLVTGKEEHEEHELVLNKIICGYEIQKPINKEFKITEKEKKECDSLLKSAIKHWTILGKTSPNGLRKSFIQRKGVITFTNKAYNLKVEQQALDILIDKIPWAFQTLKLSWNKYLILVEWSS